jgi:sec-independent protein translocase protein TatB
MFELDWAKLLIVMVVAIVVVGPKELPTMLRMLGRTLATLRRHAEQFRAQFEQSIQEITRDAGVEDIKADLRKLGELNPANQIRQTIDQAMRDAPSAQTYLRGEPAPGAAMTGFEEKTSFEEPAPHVEPQQAPPPEPQPTPELALAQEQEPAPKANKETLEQVSVH